MASNVSNLWKNKNQIAERLGDRRMLVLEDASVMSCWVSAQGSFVSVLSALLPSE